MFGLLSAGLGFLGERQARKDEQAQEAQRQAMSEKGAALADPFSAQRSKFGDLIMNLYGMGTGECAGSDPMEFFKKLPGFQFALETGLESTKRTAGAKGLRRSGNLLAELMKFGTGLASQTASQELDRLGAYSGATTGSPAAAGQIISGGFQRAPETKKFSGAGSLLGEVQKLF